MKEEEPVRGYAATVFSCRCPRCREGKLFKYPVSLGLKRNMEMHDQCNICGQPTDIELGFYYGTGYVSYLISLLICGITFILWFLVIGFSFHDKRFVTWVIFNSVLLLALQPWLMRFSRSLWLSFFVRYEPGWRNKKPDITERINQDIKDHW
jgi:uncharacterized protein (DUF983 family)